MKLLCHNEICQVFDDNNDWFCKNTNPKLNQRISKEDEPMFPLACCLKWDFKPDDIEYLNKLRNKR